MSGRTVRSRWNRDSYVHCHFDGSMVQRAVVLPPRVSYSLPTIIVSHGFFGGWPHLREVEKSVAAVVES